MILNICRVLPDMYIIIAFMGRAFAGARASSQDFLILSVSVSAGVGGLRAAVLEVRLDRCCGCNCVSEGIWGEIWWEGGGLRC